MSVQAQLPSSSRLPHITPRVRAAREPFIAQLASYLVAKAATHPLRVAIDGITAAGKTTLSHELAQAIRDRGRTALEVTGDDFHHPSARRYRQGRHNPNGYYEDAYDFDALDRLVLQPLGPGGDRRYRARYHDLSTDQILRDEPRLAPADAIVLVEGTFLQRPELAAHWDEVIFVQTSFGEARARGAQRDAQLFGGLSRAQHAFDARYHPASRRYLDELHPQDTASILVSNDDLCAPVIVRMPSL